MKKIMFMAFLLIAGVATIMATEYTAYAEITLNKTLKLREAAEFSSAFDNGADIARFNNTGIFVFANIVDQTDTEWIQFATNDLEGTTLAFKVAAAGEQTLTFANVEGAQLYLVDAVAGTKTAIVNGGSYVFTAEDADVANWNTTRFTITKVAPALPYSFINNTLVITEATVGAEVTVTPFTYGAEGKNLGAPAIYNVPVHQVLNGGYFLVTYTNAEGVAREFIVNANPDIQPANP